MITITIKHEGGQETTIIGVVSHDIDRSDNSIEIETERASYKVYYGERDSIIIREDF